ncbi:hypothetical protein H9660_15295 [Clostridium sp. Sa3CUN1]|uniref:Uncharacterized protein n=1 Tax=Clostridium gallinarum TaxID=2762246 RepID=A0ABR8Q8C7_9CLOT|nr:hypothetical protein [Clostridium gallinarum]MBD7916509.1 hypothetical protein [Clostridium gallinarum]
MLDLLVYLDELLIKNLNSLALNGYIDIRTYRRIRDTTIGGNARLSDRSSKGLDYKNQKDKIEGYKSKHNTCEEHYQDGGERSLGFEGRDFDRREQEIKKISTVFTLHNDLLSNMYNNKNVINAINFKSIEDHNLKVGDYLEITGCVQETSIPLYIDTLIESINCYGIDFLNSFIEKENLKGLDFGIISRLLEGLRVKITRNGTTDLVLKTKDTSLLLAINENNFVNNGYNTFDFVQCSCKIFGKVMMIKNDNAKCISLLRKSSQEEYYQKVLESIDPYLDLLRTRNIILPKKPQCDITGKMIMILPISICI